MYPYDHLGTWLHMDSDNPERVRFPARDIDRREQANQLLWEHMMRNRQIEASPWPLPLAVPRVDSRMAAQRALFLVSGHFDHPIDEIADNWMPPSGPTITSKAQEDLGIRWPPQRPGEVLRKMVVLPEAHKAASRALDLMGISADALFPGLDGIGRAATAHILRGDLSLRDMLEPVSDLTPRRPLAWRDGTVGG